MACSTRSICGCGLPAAQDRLRPGSTALPAIRRTKPGPGSTWRSRARVVSASPQFATRVEELIRTVLCRPRDAEMTAGDVVEMRKAIATEKGDSERWNLKYVAGGLVDLEFIAQYLQLVHAAATPDILDTSTARVLEKAW